MAAQIYFTPPYVDAIAHLLIECGALVANGDEGRYLAERAVGTAVRPRAIRDSFADAATSLLEALPSRSRLLHAPHGDRGIWHAMRVFHSTWRPGDPAFDRADRLTRVLADLEAPVAVLRGKLAFALDFEARWDWIDVDASDMCLHVLLLSDERVAAAGGVIAKLEPHVGKLQEEARVALGSVLREQARTQDRVLDWDLSYYRVPACWLGQTDVRLDDTRPRNPIGLQIAGGARMPDRRALTRAEAIVASFEKWYTPRAAEAHDRHGGALELVVPSAGPCSIQLVCGLDSNLAEGDSRMVVGQIPAPQGDDGV